MKVRSVYSQTSFNRTPFIRTPAFRTNIFGNRFTNRISNVRIPRITEPSLSASESEFPEQKCIFSVNFPRLSESVTTIHSRRWLRAAIWSIFSPSILSSNKTNVARHAIQRIVCAVHVHVLLWSESSYPFPSRT